MKCIFLFLATSITVLAVVRVILAVLGTNDTGQVDSLLAYSAVVGFGGSIISLLVSKTVAKNSVSVEVIITPRNEEEAWLLGTITAQAYRRNLKTPEVAVYHFPEPNAFATGASESSSLAAVSTGLFDHMRRDGVEVVLAHGMAHVGSGSMVMLILIQGIVNTFVVFLARIVSSMIAHSSDSSSSQGTYFLVSTVLQVVFGFLASIIVIRFSHRRGYRVDVGAAKLVGAPKVIATLRRLRGSLGDLPQGMNTMGITSDTRDSLLSMHPSPDSRIIRLEAL